MDVGCESRDCDSDATAVVFWPGRTLAMCQPCCERAHQVADHMGFRLMSADIAILSEPVRMVEVRGRFAEQPGDELEEQEEE